MVLRVTEVQPLEGYRLRITFNDGAVRDVDFAEDLERAGGTLAEPLRDPAYFRQVRVDEQLRTIVWPNGLDGVERALSACSVTFTLNASRDPVIESR